MNKKQNEPLISIVMPAYNSENYIGMAIDSVMAQTYKNWELIVIDDCSLDSTYRIAHERARLDDRIHIFKNLKNVGVASTRNKAVELAMGDWIAYLDSDDCWDRQKLEKQMDYCLENSVNFVFSASSFMNQNDVPLRGIFRVPKKISYQTLLKQNVIPCSSVLIQKNLLKKHRMEGESIHEDFAFWLRILQQEPYAYGMEEPLLIYRISQSSKSGNKLKSAAMTFRTYLFVGLTVPQSLYYLCHYTIKSIRKFCVIHSAKPCKSGARI